MLLDSILTILFVFIDLTLQAILILKQRYIANQNNRINRKIIQLSIIDIDSDFSSNLLRIIAPSVYICV